MLKLIYPFVGFFQSPCHGSDLADFLIVTVLSNALLVLGIICTVFQFVWRPIDCFVPKAFAEEHVSYTKSYCQTPLAEWYLFSPHDGLNLSKPYPQFRRDVWLPVLLLWHAVLLRLSRLVRRIISNRSDIHLTNLIKSAACYRGLEEGGKGKMAATIASILRANYSATTNERGGGAGNTFSRIKAVLRRFLPFGIHGAATFVGSIVLAACSTVAYQQLAGFLSVQSNNNSYDGSDELLEMLQRKQQRSSIFPDVILCEMPILSTGSLQKYSLQCHLPLHSFYQLLSMILWFVYILAGMTAWIASVHRLVTLFLPWPRRWFFQNCLLPVSAPAGGDEFLKSNLLTDAYFVLKSLSESADDLVTYDVVKQLWQDVVNDRNQSSGHQTQPLYQEPGIKEPLLTKQENVSRM